MADKKFGIADHQHQFIQAWCSIFKYLIIEPDRVANKWRALYRNISFLFA